MLSGYVVPLLVATMLRLRIVPCSDDSASDPPPPQPERAKPASARSEARRVGNAPGAGLPIVMAADYARARCTRRPARPPPCSGPLRPLLAQHLLEHRHDLGGAAQVRIDGEGAAEVVERALGVAELQVDLAGTRKRAEVLRIALQHLVAILQRLLEAAEQEEDRRPLVPAFGERGLLLDDRAEG